MEHSKGLAEQKAQTLQPPALFVKSGVEKSEALPSADGLADEKLTGGLPPARCNASSSSSGISAKTEVKNQELGELDPSSLIRELDGSKVATSALASAGKCTKLPGRSEDQAQLT